MFEFELFLEDCDLLEVVQLETLIVDKQHQLNTIKMFDKEYTVLIDFDKPMNDKQGKALGHFSKNKSQLLGKASTALLKYCKSNKNIDIDSVDQLSKSIKPKTILFDNDGNINLILNCSWDVEHGIGISLYPSIRIGSQDEFL